MPVKWFPAMLPSVYSTHLFGSGKSAGDREFSRQIAYRRRQKIPAGFFLLSLLWSERLRATHHSGITKIASISADRDTALSGYFSWWTHRQSAPSAAWPG